VEEGRNVHDDADAHLLGGLRQLQTHGAVRRAVPGGHRMTGHRGVQGRELDRVGDRPGVGQGELHPAGEALQLRALGQLGRQGQGPLRQLLSPGISLLPWRVCPQTVGETERHIAEGDILPPGYGPVVVCTASGRPGTVARVPRGDAQGGHGREGDKTHNSQQPRQDRHDSPPFSDTIGRDLQGLSGGGLGAGGTHGNGRVWRPDASRHRHLKSGLWVPMIQRRVRVRDR
jgi:hypothetical protein